ncbi:zinc ribbon domain-containing protein [Halegenticoccus soli]|uniref:zinc ribbon domain-containing protein n=1 Tax=Halegenticoccus soli TaxID=1985678 RepID=UPI000C6D6CF9|nr:zinc ribbon domain-containing protein [Halegenticoccus soli]
MADTRRRAVIAALLGTLGALAGIAGFGHVYLREWRRAIAWFLFVLGASILLMVAFVDPEVLATDPMSITADDLPMTVIGPIFLLLSLSIFDAYYVGRRGNRGGRGDDDGHACPHCGREVDADLDFCHWCTERLDRAVEPTDGTDGTDADATK